MVLSLTFAEVNGDFSRKSHFFHPVQLRSVRRSLSQESFTRLVVALVLARLDYCNGVLAGLPASQLSRLQSVLHAAARLIYGVRRHDHVTPLQQQLHWLSVPERVIFKLCVIFSWSRP